MKDGTRKERYSRRPKIEQGGTDSATLLRALFAPVTYFTIESARESDTPFAIRRYTYCPLGRPLKSM